MSETQARTMSRAARDLQSAANRLALMSRNHSRDTILAGLYRDAPKGVAAAARLAAQAPAMKALEEEVRALRAELGSLLDGLVPQQEGLMQDYEIEPPAKKRKKRK
jgi:hypothetical protein